MLLKINLARILQNVESKYNPHIQRSVPLPHLNSTGINVQCDPRSPLACVSIYHVSVSPTRAWRGSGDRLQYGVLPFSSIEFAGAPHVGPGEKELVVLALTELIVSGCSIRYGEKTSLLIAPHWLQRAYVPRQRYV
jgi:hypothetical protein